jgi:hypothetical protein
MKMLSFERRLSRIAREIDAFPDPNVYLVESIAHLARLAYLEENGQRPELVRYTSEMEELMDQVPRKS